MPQSYFIIEVWDMIFPSFCIRRGLHELRISCHFCVHKNSVSEIQHEISPTLFIIDPFIN